MLKKVLTSIVLASVLILSGCMTSALGSTESVYDENAMQSIQSWNLGFEYESGSIEETIKEDGSSETTLKKSQYAASVQLLDDIFYGLKDNGVKVSKKLSENEGAIRIHPVYDVVTSSLSSVSIFFYDSNDEVINRIKVNNELSIKLFFSKIPKNDDKVTKYCIEEIITALGIEN